MALVAAQDIYNRFVSYSCLFSSQNSYKKDRYYYYDTTVQELNIPKTVTLCYYDVTLLSDWPTAVTVHICKEGPEKLQEKSYHL